MTSRLNPYIGFASGAREAMEFYQSVLGGDLRISTFGEFGGAPEGMSEDQVMHAMLETPSGFTLMGSDQPGVTTTGSNITISLSGTDAEDLRRWFEGLAEGGQVTLPLEKQMWGDEFGQLTDRFGVDWMVDIVTEETAAG